MYIYTHTHVRLHVRAHTYTVGSLSGVGTQLSYICSLTPVLKGPGILVGEVMTHTSPKGLVAISQAKLEEKHDPGRLGMLGAGCGKERGTSTALVNLGVLVYSGCYNKMAQPEWLTNNTTLFLTALESGKSKIRCQHLHVC